MSSLSTRYSLLAVGCILAALVIGAVSGLIFSYFYPSLSEIGGGQIQAEHLAVGVFVFIGVCAIGLDGYLERALRPIGTLRDHFVRVRAGDLNVRLVESGPTEVVRLARAFNDTIRSMEVQVEDLSEEKEQAIRDLHSLRDQTVSNRRTAALLDSVPFAVILVDSNLEVTYGNSHAVLYLDQMPGGFKEEAGLDRLLPSGEADALLLRSRLTDPDNLPFDWAVTLAGSPVPFHAVALSDGDGEFEATAIVWDPVASSLSPSDNPPMAYPVRGPELDTGRLQRSVRLVGRSVQLLSDRIETVQSMVEALGNEGDNLRRCLEETRQRTRNASQLTSERSEVLWRLVQEAVDFAERRRSSGAVLRRLRTRLGEMEGMRESVSHLANSMESMVLNARIEFGRDSHDSNGLRVIVDEIQKLGRDSAHLSKDVEEWIGGVRTDVEEFVTQMGDERRGNRLGGRLGRRAERALERIEQDLEDVDARADLLAEITFAHTEIGRQVAEQLGKLAELVQLMVPVTGEQARIVRAADGYRGEETDEEGESEIEDLSATETGRDWTDG